MQLRKTSSDAQQHNGIMFGNSSPTNIFLNLTNGTAKWVKADDLNATNPIVVFSPIGRTNLFNGTNRFSPVWDDVVIGGLEVGVGATAPALTDYVGGIQLRAFAGSATDDQIYTTIQVPHSAVQNDPTNWNIHLHVSQATAATNFTVWETTVNSGNPDKPFGNTFTNLTTNAMSVTNFQHQIITLATITNTTGSLSKVFNVRVRRLAASNASDNNAQVVFLHSMDLHLRRDSWGSEGELLKP
jgi:hypothetical protein